MAKKKSAREVVESKSQDVERVYLRIPGREMVDVSKNSSRNNADIDLDKIESELEDYSGDYSLLHNHTTMQEEDDGEYFSIPSGGDLGYFLSEKYGKRQKTMQIAQRDGDTGEVQGYIILRKTKNTKLIPGEENPFSIYGLAREVSDMDQGREANKLLDEILHEYHIKIKYVPLKGYTYDSKKLKFVRDENLEQKIKDFVLVGGIGGSFVLSLLFYSNITGNVIGSQFSNYFGVGFIILGLFLGGMWIYKKNKTSV
tara:strand:- start:11302 stop:12069 length:768 start_codon:yes stop_codon:yes gene_type:complete